MLLKKKVAVIYGAGGAIGGAVAKTFTCRAGMATTWARR
jgi:NAD(P)-dependent dehydrogenase (short-subunit alcohol dehydrogenase family)